MSSSTDESQTDFASAFYSDSPSGCTTCGDRGCSCSSGSICSKSRSDEVSLESSDDSSDDAGCPDFSSAGAETVP